MARGLLDTRNHWWLHTHPDDDGRWSQNGREDCSSSRVPWELLHQSDGLQGQIYPVKFTRKSSNNFYETQRCKRSTLARQTAVDITCYIHCGLPCGVPLLQLWRTISRTPMTKAKDEPYLFQNHLPVAPKLMSTHYLILDLMTWINVRFVTKTCSLSPPRDFWLCTSLSRPRAATSQTSKTHSTELVYTLASTRTSASDTNTRM